MQIQRSFVLTPHSLRSGPPRCPKTGERVVTAFAAQQPTPVADEPGFNEMLETSTTIGEAVFDVVLDEAIEAVAEVGRVQAEHQRIIFQAKDLQGAVNELLQDIQTRGIPSPTDVLQRAASVLGSIQRTADERLATSRMSRQGEPTVDEYAPPVMPDPQELVEDVKDAASAAREDVKKALDGKKI